MRLLTRQYEATFRLLEACDVDTDFKYASVLVVRVPRR
jgi:hypothetical protein